ncbi:hypothetical protein GYMLUDRAFT_235906 [Collybiopsis luxurians FD-317 M1]|nr:hypothetical protein GYMLUDRAFT_235906 [Collybiopsis luxurians FD-317 M1]
MSVEIWAWEQGVFRVRKATVHLRLGLETPRPARICGAEPSIFLIWGLVKPRAIASPKGLSVITRNSGLVVNRWNEWASNYTLPQHVFNRVWPKTIPAGTAVPHWAYQSYTAGRIEAALRIIALNIDHQDNPSTFSPSLAQRLGDSPESSVTSGPTNTQFLALPAQQSAARISSCHVQNGTL